jgi:type VI secretion system protein ImpA
MLSMIETSSIFRPISEDKPSGDYLYYDASYDQIREARTEDDPSLPQGVWVTKLKTAQWDLIVKSCLELLQTRTKDLQLAAWLAEALGQTNGFPGLSEGLLILRGLCDKFWDSIHPGNTTDDLEARLAPFLWLNEKVAHKILSFPIVEVKTASDRKITCLFYQARVSQDMPAASGETARAFADAALPIETAATETRFYSENVAAIGCALEHCVWIERFLETNAGSNAPALYQIRANLQIVLALFQRVLESRAAAEDSTGGTSGERALFVQGPDDDGKSLELAKLIRTREQAYRLLSEAADFLLRTEPHSPVPYLVKRAVSWGNLNLTEVLPQLIRNPDDVAKVRELLGLNTTQKP